MLNIGLSTPGFVNEELFKEMSEAGITHSEISVSDEKSRALDFDKIKEWAQKYNITLWSFHLPFYPFDKIDISKPEIAGDTVEYLKSYIKNGSAIGIDKYVIHASGEPIADEERPLRMQTAKRSLRELSRYAKELGATIIVENLPRTCLGKNSDEILELISVDKDIKACFDTNHLLGEDYVKFIHAIGENIVTTHVSDYDFKDERHWLPGEGKIDWQRLTQALESVGYDGVWLYEIDLEAPWTINRDRALRCQDFSDNAKELFSGKTPKPIGTPKDNL